MIAGWTRRVDALADARRRAVIRRLAAHISDTIGKASVVVEETRVVVSGKGLAKRWLIDPQLRFLSGDMK